MAVAVTFSIGVRVLRPKQAMSTNVSSGNGGLTWVITALLLSLPSMLFVAAHLAVTAAGLPATIETLLAWVVAVAGMVGPVLTVAALATALAGSFQRRLPVSVRGGLWALAGMSVLS